MSVTLKQISGAQVAPVDDARLYNLILSGQTGIVQGCEVTHLGANQLQISAGWGVCQGRMFTVEQETINAVVSSSGTVSGRLLLHIDVTADTPAVFQTQATYSLPALTQEDINGNGTVYEMELATYNISRTLISSLKMKFRTVLMQAEKLKETVKIGNADFDGSFDVSLSRMGAAETSAAIATYTHVKSGTVHNLVGTGNNIKFVSTARWTPGDSLTVNGTECRCWNQNVERIETDDIFGNGAVVTATLSWASTSKVWNCFFKSGGGVSNSKLAQATATAADVRKGKTFYAGDKKLKTGAGGTGATGSFTSLQNDTIAINVGFEPSVVMATYKYSGTDHTVILYDQARPDKYKLWYGTYNGAERARELEDNFGYIAFTENGFTFRGYYTGSGNQTISYVCY